MLSRPVRCREFVGRVPELDHLVTRRRAASERRGGGVLVTGEAGIGKSRIISEFLGTTGRSSARVARTECREFAQSALGPLVDVLTQLGESPGLLRDATTPESQIELVLSAFDRISERRAAIVAIEDVHWSSPELVLILRTLVARAERQRLLFVLSYRDDEVVPAHTNYIPLGKLAREAAVTLVGLERLAPAEMLDVLRRALDGAGNVPYPVLADVARRSDGNPLYGEELLRHAVDRIARLGGSNDANVPMSLQAVVRERIARCSPADRATLATAALFGRTFDLELFVEIARGDDERTRVDLARLVDLQILERQESKGEAYRFRHALTRDVIYDDVPESVAQPIHRTIAHALEARADASQRVVELAYHRWQSGERDAEVAARCEAAAVLSRAQFAYGDCILWYRRAIEAHGADARGAAYARFELGKVLNWTQDLSASMDAYRLVESYARSGDRHLLVRVRKMMAGAMCDEGRRDEAIALLETSIAEVDRTAEPDVWNGLVVRVSLFAALKIDKSQARASISRVEPEDLESHQRGEFYMMRSEIEGAAADGDEVRWLADNARAIAIYREVGSKNFEHFTHVNTARQAFARGHLALAREHLLAAQRASVESAGSFNHLPLSFASVEHAAGNVEAMRAWIARVRPSASLASRGFEMLGALELALALDDGASVARNVDLEIVGGFRRSGDLLGAFRIGAVVAEALAYLGRTAEMEKLIDEVAPMARTTHDSIPSILALARLRPSLGSTFVPVFEARAGRAFETAGLSLLRAEMLRERDQADSRDLATAARAHFESQGWALLSARAAYLSGDLESASRIYRDAGHLAGQRAIGIIAMRVASAAPSRAARADDVSALTGREGEIARLIGAGKTNREIAFAMSISEKTVEKHLTSIYDKLGLKSRAQLAAQVARTAAS